MSMYSHFLFANQTLRKLTETECVCVSVCVGLSLASDSSDTIIKVIIIKFGTMTASDMIMHHVLVILTLIFIQGQTDIIQNTCIRYDDCGYQ